MSIEEILRKAEGLEIEYDWCGAAKNYEKAASLTSAQDFSGSSRAQERSGYAFYRAAFQVESNNEFGERMRQAVIAYEKAKELSGKSNGPLKRPRTSRCEAMIAYIGYWLTPNVIEKKRLLEECWRLTKEALEAFKEAGDGFEYGKTYNQLSTSAVLGFFYERDFQPREKMTQEAVELGERAIHFLSGLEDSQELVRAYVRTSCFLEVSGYFLLDSDQRQRHFEKANSYWQRADELSKTTTLIELLSTLGAHNLSWGTGTDEGLANLNNALQQAVKTKDALIIGCALEWLSINTFWKTSEDPDEWRENRKEALQYAEDAKRHYSLVSFTSPLGDVLWVEAPHTEYYWALAVNEVNSNDRRQLLEKALENAPYMLKCAKNSGIPQNASYAHHVFAKVLASLGQAETDFDEKRRLLEKALEHRKESIEYTESLGPSNYWDRGVMQNYLADIKWQLADLSTDDETKMKMYQEAVIDKENSLKLCIKGAGFLGKKGAIPLLWNITSWQYEYGDQLRRLYQLTRDNKCLRKAIEVFGDAAETARSLNSEYGLAWIHWKAAQAYDDLGEYSEAAEKFILATNNYSSAAKRMPRLAEYCQESALYMEAWSEIEKARHHHERQEYGLAREHFEKTAELHKLLRKWSYLEPNYSAWAQIENAEELSRKEQCEEAIRDFKQAIKLFGETKKSIQNELGKIQDPDEKQMADSMVKTTDERREYCSGRIVLEEAKILDKKGDHYSSSKKYGLAAEIFEKLYQTLESEHEQKEFKLIITLSRAWQKMTLAETEASPALYAEASQLFEKAKEFSPDEKTKMLVLGNSRFCRALEAGTRFVDTRDIDSYTDAMKCLETASSYYMKAGFPKVSEYSEATKLLFDAYLHIDGATKESDPEKKAKLYAMAEKVLQTSAGSFMKAEHPEKREQVLGLLEKTKMERELAVSLAEVLHAPSIASATTAFTTPTPTREEAVGSERFEHADIQANLVVRQRELRVGESVELEIEFVNAGKGSALLVKVSEVIPEGFEIVEKPEACRIEDSYIDMKGKRLDPLKTGEVRLVLRPKVQGAFDLKPKILYLDENGKYKSYEPESINITVKELGIRGWIRGER